MIWLVEGRDIGSFETEGSGEGGFGGCQRRFFWARTEWSEAHNEPCQGVLHMWDARVRRIVESDKWIYAALNRQQHSYITALN